MARRGRCARTARNSHRRPAVPQPLRDAGYAGLIVLLSILLGVGFWSEFRFGKPGGRAVMKMWLLVGLPDLIVAVPLLAGLTHAAHTADGSFYFGLACEPYFSDHRIALHLIGIAFIPIPLFGVIGWIGGLAARATHWLRRNRITP